MVGFESFLVQATYCLRAKAFTSIGEDKIQAIEALTEIMTITEIVKSQNGAGSDIGVVIRLLESSFERLVLDDAETAIPIPPALKGYFEEAFSTEIGQLEKFATRYAEGERQAKIEEAMVGLGEITPSNVTALGEYLTDADQAMHDAFLFEATSAFEVTDLETIEIETKY